MRCFTKVFIIIWSVNFVILKMSLLFICFLNCPFQNSEFKVSLDEITDLWTNWRPSCGFLSQTRIELDLYVMAIFWLIWQERNSRIFLQKSKSSRVVLGFICSFLTFGRKFALKTMQNVCQAREIFRGKHGKKILETLWVSLEQH